MKDVIDFFFILISIYCLILVIFGTIGNLITVYICMRKKLRAITTFIFLTFMVISDTFALYIWCLDHFLEVFFNFSIEKYSIWTCRVGLFVQYTSLEWSSWLLVGLSVDRWLSVEVKTWRALYFRPTQAFLTSMALLAILSVLNSNLLVLSGNYDKQTKTLYCYTEGLATTDWILFWQKIHSFLYSLIPLCLIGFSNSMLLYRTNKKPNSIEPSHSHHSVDTRKKFSDRKKMISFSIIVVTIGFVITTTPSALIMGFFIQDLYKSKVGKLIVWVFDALLFTYHSIKFEIILIFNYQFSKEFSQAFEEIFSKRKNLLNPRRKNLTTAQTKSITDISI